MARGGRSMNGEPWQFRVYPGGRTAHAISSPGRDYQELWFRLSRLPWASLVLVPVDRGTSAAEIATSLAEVGSSLRETPVTAIVAETIDYASARTLAQLQPRLTAGTGYRATVDVDARPVGSETAGPEAPHVATPLPPRGRAIISIQPVVDEPLGIAIAHAADAVLLCVELWKSRSSAARRTAQLIGTDRIVGAVMIR